MSSGIDIQIVRGHYRRMTDREFIRTVMQEGHQLTPEAQEIVKKEIESRNLDASILRGLDAQNKTYSVDELDVYCEQIRSLNCPICGMQNGPLNASMTSEVISLVLFTHHSRKIKIGCPDCLDKENDNALMKTIILGWWGLPWGVFRTIQAIRHNLKSKGSNHSDSPTDYLRSFTLSKIGELETYKHDKERLQQLIKPHK